VNVDSLREAAGEPTLELHPDDADPRGIRTGDRVRVFNDRGAFLAGVVVGDHLRPGVVQISTGAWYDPAEGGQPGSLEKHGNPNVVTLDGGTSQLAQSTVVQTVLVQVEKCESPRPVTAFDSPQFACRPS
jgi:biotin/methionine sulfoxide reductase